MKCERDRRLRFYIPQDRQHARRFTGADLGHDDRFARQDRARVPAQSRTIDVVLKQPGQNPSGKSARQRESKKKKGRSSETVTGRHSALPENERAQSEAEDRSRSRSADRRDSALFEARPAFGQSVDRGGAAEPRPMEVLQHSSADFRSLEKANHQCVIAFFPPKPHT